MSSRGGSIFGKLGRPVVGRFLAEQDAAVEYRSYDGEEIVALENCILGDETSDETSDEDGRSQRMQREITIPRIAGSRFATTLPPIGGRVAVGEVVYAIDAVLRSSESTVVLRLVRRPSLEQSRPGYRRRQ